MRSNYLGELPLGCKLCEKGEKLVLFVTGICDKGCYYCPLSEKRRDKDLAWANERLVKTTEDILEEAYRMNAKGAGITGGDPILKLSRTIEYITLLKSTFGKDFHIHLYTSHVINRKNLKNLKKAGLEEIRFHELNRGLWNTIEKSVETGIETGIEIPAIPGEEEQIIKTARRLKDLKGSFLNLNELEFSDTNAASLKKREYNLKSDISYAAKGSEETARKVLESGIEFNIHYCSSSFKDSIQLKNRLIRTAKNTAKAFEEITSEGLLLKGIIEFKNIKKDLSILKNVRQNLVEEFEIPDNLISVDIGKNRLETSIEIAIFLSENYSQNDAMVSVIEEYPTSDRLETTKRPL